MENLLEIFRRHIPTLTQVGTGPEHLGKCPFNSSEDNRKPKFYVNGESGMYHCKRCGASGNFKTFASAFGERSNQSKTTNITYAVSDIDAAEVKAYHWYLEDDKSLWRPSWHIGYLEPTPKNAKTFRECDPSLYDTLAEIVRGESRSVSAIRQRRVLPDDTVFYERLLDLNSETVDARRVSRIQAREQWVKCAVQATEDCDVVFVDPDNGIGTTAQASTRFGAKYVLLEELIPYLDMGQTLVIYHHLNRTATADVQIRLSGTRLGDIFGRNSRCSAVRFRRGSARVFFVVQQKEHETTLQRRLARMLATPWGAHFCPYSLEA